MAPVESSQPSSHHEIDKLFSLSPVLIPDPQNQEHNTCYLMPVNKRNFFYPPWNLKKVSE